MAMKIRRNHDAGKAIDTAFFMSANFNEDEIIAQLRSRFDNVYDAMRLYFDFKEKHRDYVWPKEVPPFVYTSLEAGARNFLVNYLCMNLNFVTCTHDDVLALLRNRDLMMRQFLEVTFPKATNTVIDKLMRRSGTGLVSTMVQDLPYDPEIKMHIALMLNDFTHYHNVLLETYQTVYAWVDTLHTTPEAQAVFDTIIEQIKDPLYGTVERFKNIFKLPDTVTSFPFYFVLLNPFILHYNVSSPLCFGLGVRFKDGIENQYHMKHVTLKSYHKVMGYELRFNILNMFGEYKVLCAGDIAHYLQMQNSAVYVHINELLLNDIITNADPDNMARKGQKKYFKANPEYFKVINEDMREVCNKLISVNHKGVDRYDKPKPPRKGQSND